MLFKRKNDKTQTAVQENRREPRYHTVARVCINGFEGEAVLRNINSGGFRMESRTYAAIAVGERYDMRITPENTSNLTPFDLGVEVRWVQSTEDNFNSGFFIVDRPANGVFDKYVNYIKIKTAQ
jgi:hypothetical protein